MKMWKCAICLVGCLGLAGLAGAAQVLSFDYANNAAAQADWAVGGDFLAYEAGNSTPTLTASADRQEGASSLGIQYIHNNHQYVVVYLTKTFSPALDLSSGKKFTVKVKADDAVAADMWVIFKFKSPNGYNFRYVSGDTFPGGNQWTTFEFTFAEMSIDGWDPHAVFDSVNLKEINELSIGLMKNDANVNAGTVNLLLDDMRIESTAGTVGETVIDDFNSYADDAAIQAVWVPINSTSSLSTVDVKTTTTAAEGAKALQLDAINMQGNYGYGAVRTFPAPVDMSDVKYFQLWMRGTTLTHSALFLLYLEDTAGQRCRAWLSNAMWDNQWYCYQIVASYAPSKNPSDPAQFYGEYNDIADWNKGVDVFHQSVWDGPYPDLTDCDLTQISKIILQPGTGEVSNSTRLIIDRIVAGRTQIEQPASARIWSIYE